MMRSARAVLVVLLVAAISAFTTLYGPSSRGMSDIGHADIQTREPIVGTQSPPVRRQHGSSTGITTASSQPHDRSAIDDLKIDVSCSAWKCSCQVLSDMTGVYHLLRFYGTTTKEQQRWWAKNQCKTTPAGPPPAPLPPLTGPASNVDDVCYMILYGGKLGNNNDDDAWRAFLQTWPKRIRGGTSRVYRVLSEQGAKDVGIDGKEAINGSGRVDHTQGIVRLPLRETYDTLAIKSLAMWRYVSHSFTSDGWSARCAWFVKVDTDSWVNVPLLEARLGCLSPDKAIYSGFSHRGLCFGGFYLLSRELVRSVDSWMDSFLVHNNLPLNAAEDMIFAALSVSNMVPIRKIATSDQYVFNSDRRYGWNKVADIFVSIRSDQRRACMLAMHPIKNMSRLISTDALWESTTKKLPDFHNQTLRQELCFSSNVMPEKQDDLIVEMMVCTKRIPH